MGLGLPVWKYKNVDAFPFARRIEPAVPGAIVWMVPRLSDIDLARRNFATGELLGYQGTPTVDEHYTIGTGYDGSYLRAGVMEPEEFTVCLIAKRDDTGADNAHRGVLFGSYGGAAVPGALCYWQDASTLRFQAYQTTDTQKVTTLTPTNPTTLCRYTFRVNAAAVSAINETEVVSDSEPLTAARQPGTLPINILASNSNTIVGTQGLYSFAMWPFTLDTDQRAAHWAQMALQAARDGVTIN